MAEPQIQFRENGRGTPLVLVHGFPFDGRMWDAQLRGLAGDCRVIVPDLPGFGQSQPPRAFTVASVAAELHELLQRNHALPCVLGGLSMGGYVCFEFAAQFPGDLKGLVLMDTRCEADSDEAKENRNRMIQIARERGSRPIADSMEPKLLAPDTATSRPAVREKLRQMMDAAPAESVAHCLAALRDRADSRGRLGAIGVPTLVIVGESDAITPPEVMRTIQQGIAGAEMVVIGQAGHLTPMEQPEAVNEALRSFAARIG